MSRNLQGLLAYMPLAGSALLLGRPGDPELRFHAWQGTMLFLTIAILDLALWVLMAASYRVSWYLGEEAFQGLMWIYATEPALWLWLAFRGYGLKRTSIPWVSGTAESLSGIKASQ